MPNTIETTDGKEPSRWTGNTVVAYICHAVSYRLTVGTGMAE